VKNIQAGQDIRVSRLATLVLINEGIDINNWDCAIYNDVGVPIAATIALLHQVKYS